MEALKAQRKTLRTEFTVAAKNVKQHLAILKADDKVLVFIPMQRTRVQNYRVDFQFSNCNRELFKGDSTAEGKIWPGGSFGTNLCARSSLVMKNAVAGKGSPDLATLYDILETKLRA
ncbi:hypothetical protein AVEN_178350-1 [Araneus ventricosus]|uniref:Uncharacterized protein n=1 Tax=Araneus ventricosus TaxID=182803 RepID=A0A4Y2BFL3_ARAVE|nr:hypothetical protein AVEN_178350-1 [Araneus ventricosus]